ncbi:MAG TPA: FkbM family methyltransferase [Humisphaera sp.]|nr:FkbM family methyltransferase [Humisphaera sp.]
MLRALRERIKRAPIVGPALHRLYLRKFHHEGELLRISGGLLRDKYWVRFMRTHNDDYVRGNYESEVQAVLARHLRAGMTFFDVGANAGFFSLLGSSIVGTSGKVVSFEPHPETAEQLRAQMAANSVNNVTVVEAAVCEKIGTHKFSDDTAAVMAALDTAKAATRTVTVKTTTLDHEVQSKSVPDVLKIDVEGAEIDVIRGAKQLIAQRRPILLVEIHSNELAAEYDKAMADLSYNTHSLSGSEISAAESGERFVISTPRD